MFPQPICGKGFSGLSAIIREEFQADPTDGSLFLFINRRRDRMKLLHFADGGFWLLLPTTRVWDLRNASSRQAGLVSIAARCDRVVDASFGCVAGSGREAPKTLCVVRRTEFDTPPEQSLESFGKSRTIGLASRAKIRIVADMNEMIKLSKSQLLEVVAKQTSKLADQAKQAARKDDVIKQLEAKVKQLEKDYEKLWRERFAAKSERYIRDPDQLRLDFGDTDEAADAAEGLADAAEEAGVVAAHQRRKRKKRK